MKSSAFWNVRPSPKPRPHRRTHPRHVAIVQENLPAVGLSRPEQALKVVVLPAPFGPTNPVMRAIGASRLTSSTARTPPNWTDSSRTARPALSGTPAATRRAISRSARALCFSSAAASDDQLFELALRQDGLGCSAAPAVDDPDADSWGTEGTRFTCTANVAAESPKSIDS